MRLTSLFQYQKLFEGAADYQAMINAFPYDHVVRANSETGAVLGNNLPEDVKGRLETCLSYAKRVLKRHDRIIWWMNLNRTQEYIQTVVLQYKKALKSEYDGDVPYFSKEERTINPPPLPRFMKSLPLDQILERYYNGASLSSLYNRLEHYLSIDYYKIQEHIWGNDSPNELMDYFREWEEEYKRKESEMLRPDNSHTVILQFGQYVWVNLNKAGCRDEGKGGRHCGNMPRSHTNDRVLSFRRNVKGRQEIILTFVLEEDGRLGERKGYANNKPKPEYHPYIVELLKQPFIKGFKSGRWATNQDFQIVDMTPELARELYTVRPDLFEVFDVFHAFGKDSPELVQMFQDQPLKFSLSTIEDIYGTESPEYLDWMLRTETYLGKGVNAVWNSKAHAPLLIRKAIKSGNIHVSLEKVRSLFGKDSPAAKRLYDLKLSNLDNTIAYELASEGGILQTAEMTIRAAVARGYDISRISDSMIFTNFSPDDPIFEKRLDTVVRTIKPEGYYKLIRESNLLSQTEQMVDKVLNAGNPNFGLINLNGWGVTLTKERVETVIRNGGGLKGLAYDNFLKLLGIDNPYFKQYLLSPNVDKESIYGKEIFDILNEDEMIRVIENGSIAPSLQSAIVDQYWYDSPVVKAMIGSHWLDLKDLENLTVKDDPILPKAREAVTHYIKELLLDHIVEIKEPYVVFEKLDIEQAADKFTGYIGRYAAKLWTGDTEYESNTSHLDAYLENYFDYLHLPARDAENKPIHNMTRSYEMKYVYRRYIKENHMDLWNEATDYEELDKASVGELLTFLNDNSGEWSDAFDMSYRDADESAETTAHTKALKSFLDEWNEEFGTHKRFLAQKGKDGNYVKGVTDLDEPIYIVAILSELVEETHFKLKNFLKARAGVIDIDNTDITDFFDFDPEDYYRIDYYYQKDIYVRDNIYPDKEYMMDVFYEHMPVDLDYIKECQPKKP